MGSVGENSSTGDVGGDGVGGLREEDDFTFFCAGCDVSMVAAANVAIDEEAPAPEEITDAKMRGARGGSTSLVSAKWMNSCRSSPLRLSKAR